MGMLDGIGDKVAENADTIKGGVEKVGDVIAEKTGGKFDDKIEKAEEFIKDQVDKAAEKK